MQIHEIHIRDPYVLCVDGLYYMYGTRGAGFGMQTGGFDVYVSKDLKTFCEPISCFDSEAYGMNYEANWAPEVHVYQGSYYMFATFTQEHNHLRGTYVLRAESPVGPFVPHSNGAVTPKEWECLDATLYINKQGKPYLVFCHEHTQIIDGTICIAPLKEDLTEIAGEVTTLFSASSPEWADQKPEGEHYVTDGPFLYRTKSGELLMLWSTFVKGSYAQCLVRFHEGELSEQFTHLPPLLVSDGGHGMVFRKQQELYLVVHEPNTPGFERPKFVALEDDGDRLLKKV